MATSMPYYVNSALSFDHKDSGKHSPVPTYSRQSPKSKAVGSNSGGSTEERPKMPSMQELLTDALATKPTTKSSSNDNKSNEMTNHSSSKEYNKTPPPRVTRQNRRNSWSSGMSIRDIATHEHARNLVESKVLPSTTTAKVVSTTSSSVDVDDDSHIDDDNLFGMFQWAAFKDKPRDGRTPLKKRGNASPVGIRDGSVPTRSTSMSETIETIDATMKRIQANQKLLGTNTAVPKQNDDLHRSQSDHVKSKNRTGSNHSKARLIHDDSQDERTRLTSTRHDEEKERKSRRHRRSHSVGAMESSLRCISASTAANNDAIPTPPRKDRKHKKSKKDKKRTKKDKHKKEGKSEHSKKSSRSSRKERVSKEESAAQRLIKKGQHNEGVTNGNLEKVELDVHLPSLQGAGDIAGKLNRFLTIDTPAPGVDREPETLRLEIQGTTNKVSEQAESTEVSTKRSPGSEELPWRPAFPKISSHSTMGDSTVGETSVILQFEPGKDGHVDRVRPDRSNASWVTIEDPEGNKRGGHITGMPPYRSAMLEKSKSVSAAIMSSSGPRSVRRVNPNSRMQRGTSVRGALRGVFLRQRSVNPKSMFQREQSSSLLGGSDSEEDSSGGPSLTSLWKADLPLSG